MTLHPDEGSSLSHPESGPVVPLLRPVGAAPSFGPVVAWGGGVCSSLSGTYQSLYGTRV